GGTSRSGWGGGRDVGPIYEYRHGRMGECIIGGAFARGGAFAALAGEYVFADFGDGSDDPTSGVIFRATPTPSRDGIAGDPQPIVTQVAGPVDLVFGPDGALYYAAFLAGEIRRVAVDDSGPACAGTVSFAALDCRIDALAAAIANAGDRGAVNRTLGSR